jgi:ABC-type nickel/cobalt efflux system permease component RcnA
VNGKRLTLHAASHDVIFPPGAGGLPTLKLGILYRAALERAPAGAHQLRYRDENFPDRAGWKEVIAVAGEPITLVESSVPDRDRSRELADYPTDLLNSPPQVLEARVVFALPAAVASAGAPPSSGPAPARAPSSPLPPPPAWPATEAEDRIELQPNARATPRDAFTELVATRELGAGVVVFALVVAAVLGAFHALEPGHGKTVVAAYLVGSRGTARHAVILGLIVTASHTAGVYLLGAVTFYASNYIVPERLYPWLGGASGLTIAGLGLVLFTRRYAGIHSQPHHHDDRHHGAAPHTHGPDADHHHDHEPGVRPSLRELFALGITGGIIPCPAALVVLLSALSLRRVGFGLLLIVAFSVGLALVLIAIGVLMVYARRLMAGFGEGGPLVTRWLPLTSSAIMTLFGVAIAVQSLAPAGILQVLLG